MNAASAALDAAVSRVTYAVEYLVYALVVLAFELLRGRDPRHVERLARVMRPER